MPDVTVASTSDSQDQVNQAAGYIQTEETEERPAPTGDAQVESGEPEAPPEPEGDKQEGKDGKQQGGRGRDRRIDKLTKANTALQAQLQEVLAKLNQPASQIKEESKPIQEQPPTTATAKAAELDPEPTPDQYETYEKYNVAVGRWAARAELRAIENKRILQEQATHQRAEIERGEKLAEALMERGEEKYEDFPGMARGLFADTPRADALLAAIVEEDNGEDVIVYLRQNEEVRKKLIAMPVAKAMPEIGKIALRLGGGGAPEQDKNNAANNKSPDRKPVISSAPPPIKPLGGHGINAAKPSYDNMSQADYNRLRDKEEKARRGY